MTPANGQPGRATRHFSHQPNVPGRGIVAGYSPAFWGLVVTIGVASGLAAALLTLLWDGVQHAAWDYHAGTFLDAVMGATAARHIVVLLAAGVIAGIVGLLIRRVRSSGAGEVSEALWWHEGRLSFWLSQSRAVLSTVIVGMGASLGREAAPQLSGGAMATVLSEWARIPTWQRRLLVACGAGSGMAAVYNVPLGGALFAVEVLLGTLSLPLVLPAVAMSAVATAVARVVVPAAPVYLVPVFGVHESQLVWALVIGPVAGVVAVCWVRTIAAVNSLKPRRWGRVVAPIVLFSALGATSIAYPEILGNGKDTVEQALTNQLAIGLVAILLLLKPLATAACLGSGAPGGLFTPTLTLGVLFGDLLGHGWAVIWPGPAIGSYAIIGGAAVLAASMQGPLSAVVLILELTHTADGLMVPILLAVAEATIVARVLGAPSIYSARLSEDVTRARPSLGPLEPEPPAAPAPPPEGATGVGSLETAPALSSHHVDPAAPGTIEQEGST
ncbi:MAG TPA: chloride channel protein [Solirubrobacteraceae bacterium]